MADTARVSARDVRYAYPGDDRDVLTGASLDVAPGEIHALMGANGAGKTTLLRLIAGLREPDAGVIEIGNGDGDILEGGSAVGYAPENPKNGFFAESVENEVAFFPSNRGLAVDERVDVALEAMEITHLRDRMPLSLSGGEQRMVSIASVLAGAPTVLALDEPTTHLHRHAERKLGGVLSDLGRTVLLSTHDADFAFEFADTVSIIRDGQVTRTGTPHAVLEDLERMLGAGIRPPGIVEWAHRKGLDRIPDSIEAAAELDVSTEVD